MVKSRITGKYVIESGANMEGTARQNFVEFRNKLCGTSYDWKHFAKEYVSEKVTIVKSEKG